ncbi:MAG TPA: S53 family peptidase [Candidatus Limnocylindrales bacterium]|jgi:subtilase family serine protease|nr:S53 family peptidase [Candidatus Limnocylindrales bacterium]
MKKIALFSLSMLVLLAVALPLVAQQRDGSHIFAQPPIRILNPQPDSPGPHGLFPAQIKAAYGFNSTPNQGAGQIIGIVDAYDDPNAESDLQVYDTQFGLPTCTTGNGCFTKIKVGNPPGDSGWGLEISLDIQQAHGLAPAAKVILVEANSNSFADLLAAVDVARQNGATQISMSWSGGEDPSELGFDSFFNHPGVTFMASTGDGGHGVGYPAASPYVVAVGGTTLVLSTATPLPNPLLSNYGHETAWSGSGGGISAYEPGQAYQDGVFAGCGSTGMRCVPDISSDANPGTGVPVYDTYGYGGWIQVGGTSVSSPDWSAVFAVANSSRAAAGKGTLQTAIADLYTFYNSTQYTDFHDITSGTNGSCGAQCTAIVGYDLVTGIGSPKVNKLVPALVAIEP